MSERKRIIHIILRDEEDKKLCQHAAKLNNFSNMGEWMRAIINGHLRMSNLRPLKYIGLRRYQCRNGHPYDKKNTLWGKDKKTGRKFKLCKICRNISYNKSYLKRKNNGPKLHKAS